MEIKQTLPRTIAEFIDSYWSSKFSDEMQAIDRVLRQLAANWLSVQDGHSMPDWGYGLTIPSGEFLAQAQLSPADVEYIQRILAHVPFPNADEDGQELTIDQRAQFQRDSCNPQRYGLRMIFRDLSHGLTIEMVNGLRTMLPDDLDQEYVIRPHHLPALRVLHILLLRSGFWAKQLRDPWLNCAEAGYDPTAVPEINDSNMALAYTNREGAHYNGRPEINEIDTFYRNIYDDEGSLADGERLHNYELALMTLASLVDPKLADFNDAYWHFVEENEG